MRRVGRKIQIALLVVLPFFLCLVTTVTAPAYRTQPGVPAGIDSPVDMENSGTESIALVFLGAGILNLAIWGRNHFRRGPTISGDSL